MNIDLGDPKSKSPRKIKSIFNSNKKPDETPEKI